MTVFLVSTGCVQQNVFSMLQQDSFLFLQIQSKLSASPEHCEDDVFIPQSGQWADSPPVNLHLTTASPTASTSSTLVQSHTSSISRKMDHFLEMQQLLMQQMVRPNSDCMKEVFIDYVYEVHPSLWDPCSGTS